MCERPWCELALQIFIPLGHIELGKREEVYNYIFLKYFVVSWGEMVTVKTFLIGIGNGNNIGLVFLLKIMFNIWKKCFQIQTLRFSEIMIKKLTAASQDKLLSWHRVPLNMFCTNRYQKGKLVWRRDCRN